MKRTAFQLLQALAAVLVIGALDVWSGLEISASPFYVLVVGYTAWRIGQRSSIVVAFASAGMAVVADHLLSRPHLEFANSFSHPGVPWWNGAARLFVYLSLAMIIAALRRSIFTRDALVMDLQRALAEVRTLQGLLPICAWCKRIRDEEHGAKWVPVEWYVAQKTDAEFTHGICPECAASKLSVTTREP